MKEREEYKWRKRVREEKKVKFPILLYIAAYLCHGFKMKYPDSWQIHQPFIEMLMHGKEINTSIKWQTART